MLIEKKRVRKNSILISLFTTSVCCRSCEHCIMAHLMSANPRYQMSLEELQKFIDISRKCGYRFEIMLTGGEPLLWENFKEGIKRLRSSGVCSHLSLFTNAYNIAPLLDDDTLSCIDTIKLSAYRENIANAEILMQRFPAKVQIFRGEQFCVNPVESVPKTLPAVCLNHEIFLYNYCVYACPHSASIAAGNKSKLKLCNPLRPGFLSGLSHIRKIQQSEICTYCISNAKVKAKVRIVDNVSSK